MNKYHAEVNFGYGQAPIRFTTQELDVLLARFTSEVQKERQRRREARTYTVVEPNLTVEFCRSWHEFEQYEHTRA